MASVALDSGLAPAGHYARPVPRPRVYPEDLRDRLVDAAAVRLANSGPQDLSLREIAASQDTSTNAIYSIFGGKDELIAAAVDAAASSFAAAQDAAVDGEPTVETLFALAAAHRAWALAHPALYQVMFGCVMSPPPAGRRRGRPGALTRVVSHLREEGELRDDDVSADDDRLTLLSAVHGFVMLEITDAVPIGDGARQLRRLVEAVLAGILPAHVHAA